MQGHWRESAYALYYLNPIPQVTEIEFKVDACLSFVHTEGGYRNEGISGHFSESQRKKIAAEWQWILSKTTSDEETRQFSIQWHLNKPKNSLRFALLLKEREKKRKANSPVCHTVTMTPAQVIGCCFN